MKLCVPAIVNLFFLVLYIVQSRFRPELMSVLISLVITYAINKLCLTGYHYLAWGLLFLPMILTFVMLLLLVLLKKSVEPFSMNYTNYPMIYCSLSKGCGCNN